MTGNSTAMSRHRNSFDRFPDSVVATMRAQRPNALSRPDCCTRTTDVLRQRRQRHCAILSTNNGHPLPTATSRDHPCLSRRIPRWEHEHLFDAVQQRLDANPQAMRQRRETVEHPFGTIKARMGATHFLTKTLPKVAAEMALSVLAYNLTRVMNIVGIKPLMATIVA
jgi:Transposase DDE domain